MLVTFADNQTLVAESGTPTVITTDPLPIQDPQLSGLTLSLNLHRAFALGASPGWRLDVQYQGSNDGQTWQDDGPGFFVTTETNSSLAGGSSFAFGRVKVTLTVTGGDWAAATFDVHGYFRNV